MFEFPVIVGDIGGTNARFALVEREGDARLLSHEHTADHRTIVSAMQASLKAGGDAKPRSALLAVAARVEGPSVRLTNADWSIDGREIGPALGLASVTVVNDYVPVAAALTRLDPPDLTRLGPDLSPGHGARVVLGPGTGFGAAALVPFADRLAIVSTEAGHIEFGPSDAEEAEFWPRIEQAHGRWTVEALLSGPGLSRIHAALAPGTSLHPNEVTKAGLDGSDPAAVRSLDLFGKLLGRICGDLALLFNATGGVYIGGGIAPRIVDVLRNGRFREAFERKAPHADVVRRIPTSVMTTADPALVGLAALAQEPGRFSYDGQLWSGQVPGAAAEAD